MAFRLVSQDGATSRAEGPVLCCNVLCSMFCPDDSEGSLHPFALPPNVAFCKLWDVTLVTLYYINHWVHPKTNWHCLGRKQMQQASWGPWDSTLNWGLITEASSILGEYSDFYPHLKEPEEFVQAQKRPSESWKEWEGKGSNFFSPPYPFNLLLAPPLPRPWKNNKSHWEWLYHLLEEAT